MIPGKWRQSNVRPTGKGFYYSKRAGSARSHSLLRPSVSRPERVSYAIMCFGAGSIMGLPQWDSGYQDNVRFNFLSLLLSVQSLLFLCNQMVPAWGNEFEQGANVPTQQNAKSVEPTIVDASALNHNSTLNLPLNSTTVIDFANSQTVTIGDLINGGTLVFASSNPAITSASVFSSAIINQATASMLTSAAQLNIGGFFPISNLLLSSASSFVNQGNISASGNLSIAAAGQIINNGSIISQSNLNMSAASLANTQLLSAMQNVNLQIANIQNQGQILSALGNINITSTAAAGTIANSLSTSGLASILGDIQLNNIAGLISAQNGVVNIRDLMYNGTAELNIDGGNIVCRELNLNNGNGNIVAHIASTNGIVNTIGSCASLSVQDQNLTLGNLQISGDPTYFNNTGDITISGNIQVGAALSIIAAQNIKTTNAVSLITTSGGTGQGHKIYMVAGANITAGAGPSNSIGATPPVVGAATAPVSIDMTTPGVGGEIDLSASPNLTISSASTCLGCAGGNIVLAAFNDGAGTGGLIKMASPTPITTGTRLVSASASGTAGNISIFAGAQAGNNVIGEIDARGSSSATSGSISIAAAQPTSSDGKSIQFGVNGEIISNNSFTAGIVSKSSINLHHNVYGSAINITTGGNIESIAGVIAQITTPGNQPNATVINQSGTFVYTVDSIDSLLTKISTSTNSVVATKTISLVPGSSPLSIAISPDGLRLYVADTSLNLLHVYDANTLVELTPAAPTGAAPRSIAISPDGKQVFVANQNSNTISVHDSMTLATTQVIATTGSPVSVIYNAANSSIYAALSSNNTLFGFDMLNNKTLTPVALAAVPTSIGPCPCGTKLFVATPQSGVLQGVSLIGAPIVNIPIANGNQVNALAITPNGAYAYMTEPTSTQLTLVQTLTSSVHQSIPLNVNAQVNGAYAGFVGSNPVAYVPNGKQVAVVQTPALLAPNITLDAGGKIAVAAGIAGTSTNLTSNSGASTVVTSISNFISSGANTKTGPLQYATTNSITFNGPVSAPLADFHAMYGTFTNNSTIDITGPVLALAAPTVVNNGLMKLTGVAGARTFFQAPSGALQVVLGSGSQIISDSAAKNGLIDFNPAKGTAITVSGAGSLSANLATRVDGNSEIYSTNISIGSLIGGFRTLAKPASLSLITQSGNIDIIESINTSSLTKSGGNIYVQAAGGAITTAASPPAVDFNSDSAAGPGTRAGNITLISKNGIFINGGLTANGSAGSNGGSITLLTSGNIAQCNCGGGGISASSTGGSGGTVTLQGKLLGIYGLNPDTSSISVSSDVGAGGTINAQSTDTTNRLTVACPTCNGFAGSLTANGSSGGRINLATNSGFEVKAGGTVSATGSTGVGGILQIMGNPGQTLNAIIDGNVLARNTADTSGVVGFNSFFEGGVNLSGSGTLHGGGTVAFGNLDPSTGLPINAAIFPASTDFTYGSITANLGGSLIGNTISVGRAPLPQSKAPVLQSADKAVAAPLNIPSLLANTTIIPTDQTPEALQTTVRNFPKDVTPDGRGIATALAFNSDVAALSAQGITASQGANSTLTIDYGNVLFIAQEKISINTRLGTLELTPGNIVFLMVDGDSFNVLNLHDEFYNSPIITAGNRSTEFGVGQAILVSSSKAVQNSNQIAFRQEEKLFSNGQILMRSAQFSWTSAISSISKLKSMQSSDQITERKAIAQILKNAAIFSLVGSRFGPYK